MKKTKKEQVKRSNAALLFSLHTNRHSVLFCCFQALLELVNTSAGINKLLFTGEKRMAFRANFNADAILCGASNKLFSAGAFNRYFFVFGMQSFLHLYAHSFLARASLTDAGSSTLLQ